MRARKPKLTIPKKDQKQLETIARSRMEPTGRIQRAKILLMYAEGEKTTRIAQKVNAARPLVCRAIDKALAFGVLQSSAGLKRSGRSRKTDDSAKNGYSRQPAGSLRIAVMLPGPGPAANLFNIYKNMRQKIGASVYKKSAEAKYIIFYLNSASV